MHACISKKFFLPANFQNARSRKQASVHNLFNIKLFSPPASTNHDFTFLRKISFPTHILKVQAKFYVDSPPKVDANHDNAFEPVHKPMFLLAI